MANGGAEKLEVRNAVTKPLHAIPYASPPINEPVVLGASFVISTAEEMEHACAYYRARPLDCQKRDSESDGVQPSGRQRRRQWILHSWD
jgi:Pirin C-terminal cupin domain